MTISELLLDGQAFFEQSEHVASVHASIGASPASAMWRITGPNSSATLSMNFASLDPSLWLGAVQPRWEAVLNRIEGQ